VSKYKATKTGAYDSKKEARRAAELRIMEKAGQITCLIEQPVFELIPSQKDQSGRVIERPLKYKADFQYIQGGKVVVEDVKGFETREFIIKRKLMLYLRGIKIKIT
jgi:hypothetical protein